MSSSLTSADIVCFRSTPTVPDSVVCTLAQPAASTNAKSAAFRRQEESAAEGNFCRTLEPPHRQHQQQDDDHEADDTRRRIPPACAVRPGGQHADEDENEHDQEDQREGHFAFLVAGAATAPRRVSSCRFHAPGVAYRLQRIRRQRRVRDEAGFVARPAPFLLGVVMFRTSLLAGLIGLASLAGSPSIAVAEEVPRAGYVAEHERIDAEYSVAKERCDRYAGNAKEVCVAEARAARRI